MSIDGVSPLLALPVELVHRIFDFLDVETLLLVLHYVSKDFYRTAIGYSRYQLDFTGMSKSRCRSICRVIDPDRVISLTLTDDQHTLGQIALFLSLFKISQFTRLRSLTVREITSAQLSIILTDLPVSCLRSLSISRQSYARFEKESSDTCLEECLRRATLHSLDLNIWYEMARPLSWSSQHRLQRLAIHNSITMEQYCDILRHLSSLRICVLNNLRMTEGIDGVDATPSCHSMLSLTLNSRFMKMYELEHILSFTPSLVHLRLMGKANLTDGSFNGDRWDALIRTKLSLLQRLELNLISVVYISEVNEKLQSIIQPYQTPFWLEKKRWFVACSYIEDRSLLRLYSIPLFQQHVDYSPRENFVSTLADTSSLRNNVTQLSLKATDLTAEISSLQDRPLFPQVIQVQCYLNCALSVGSLQSFVDLSQLTGLSVRFDFHQLAQPTTMNLLTDLFTRVPRVESLSLVDQWPRELSSDVLELVDSILPSQVKYLHTNLHSTTDHLRRLLVRLPCLSSLTMHSSDRLGQFSELIDWLREERIDVSSRISVSSLCIWLGR